MIPREIEEDVPDMHQLGEHQAESLERPHQLVSRAGKEVPEADARSPHNGKRKVHNEMARGHTYDRRECLVRALRRLAAARI